MRLSIWIMIVLGLLFLFTGCKKSTPDVAPIQDQNGKITFANQLISIEIDPSTKMNFTFRRGEKKLSLLVPAGETMQTPHTLIANGEAVNDFRLQADKTRQTEVQTEFGAGKLLQVYALSTGASKMTIQKELRITLLEKYPDLTLIEAVYTNLHLQQKLAIDQINSNNFQLDRRQVNPSELPYNFWNFSGFGKVIGGRHHNIRVNVLPILADTDIANNSEEISGVPLVDIWAPEIGMAIAGIEKRARILEMPVKVDNQGIVNISIIEKPEIALRSGESYSTVKTAVIFHSLDYFNPLKRYAQLMADQGMIPKPCPDFGYLPFWCNWGYRTEWSLDHGLDRLDEFEALGIKAITIDDGWFDEYGDWYPSPRRFPGGDAQLKEWVEKIHAAGLKAVFWWVPGIGGPRTAEEHPEWLILDRNGKKISIHWKNSFMLCPSVPEVIEHHRKLTEKFISEYGFDGFKMDGIYLAPRCYNPAHRHADPAESYADYEDIFKAIYETAIRLKPEGDFVLGMCPCGAFCSPYFLQWGNRPVAADPPQRALTTRYRVKAYKALLGAYSCVDNDFRERYNDYFPVEFGAGGLMTTKYTKLSAYEFAQFKKWYGLFNRYKINSGEYLNLYDIAYDIPETYAIKKDGAYFYTFLKPQINGPENVPWFEDQIETREQMLREFDNELAKLPIWRGTVELRGLENKKYTVYDIESDLKLGNVEGPVGQLPIEFKDHLIVRVVPETE